MYLSLEEMLLFLILITITVIVSNAVGAYGSGRIVNFMLDNKIRSVGLDFDERLSEFKDVSRTTEGRFRKLTKESLEALESVIPNFDASDGIMGVIGKIGPDIVKWWIEKQEGKGSDGKALPASTSDIVTIEDIDHDLGKLDAAAKKLIALKQKLVKEAKKSPVNVG